jgi:hypothetical protein
MGAGRAATVAVASRPQMDLNANNSHRRGNRIPVSFDTMRFEAAPDHQTSSAVRWFLSHFEPLQSGTPQENSVRKKGRCAENWRAWYGPWRSESKTRARRIAFLIRKAVFLSVAASGSSVCSVSSLNRQEPSSTACHKSAFVEL